MIIGVTGGVGCGKSSVLSLLQEKYNAVIIMADEVAKELMLPGNASYYAVAEYFGNSILMNGTGSEIDRKKLAAIVFHDQSKLEALNQMTHPLVKEKIITMLNDYQKEQRNLIVLESAILIQAGYLDLIDELWVINTDYSKRVERLISSRGYSKEKIDSIIKNQLSDTELLKYADFCIDNSHDIQFTLKQIQEHFKNAGNHN